MTIYAKLLRLPFFQGIDRDELEAMASKIRFDFQKYDEGAWIARGERSLRHAHAGHDGQCGG